MKTTSSLSHLRWILAVLLLAAPATAAVGNFIPGVHDNLQPPSSGAANWCSPTAALNVVAYWELTAGHANAQGLLDPVDPAIPPGMGPGSTTSTHVG